MLQFTLQLGNMAVVCNCMIRQHAVLDRLVSTQRQHAVFSHTRLKYPAAQSRTYYQQAKQKNNNTRELTPLPPTTAAQSCSPPRDCLSAEKQCRQLNSRPAFPGTLDLFTHLRYAMLLGTSLLPRARGRSDRKLAETARKPFVSYMAGEGVGSIQQAKLVLLGDMGAGKSSLVLRFVKGQFFDYQVRPGIPTTIL